MLQEPLKVIHALIIMVTVIIIITFLRGCFAPKPQPPATVIIKIDSSFYSHTNVTPVQAQPIYIGSGQTPASVREKETIYRIDTAATKEFMAAQYAKLVDAFLKSNYFRDTLKIDSVGYVAVNDTTQKNMLTGRSFSYNLKYPIITKTVTVTNPPERKNQLYLYGGVEGNKTDPLKGLGVRTGVLFKNKNDRMISGGISFWPGHQNQLDFNYYQKISFKKK